MYDRKKDPYQLDNLAKDKRYKPIKKAMRKRLALLRPCVGASQCYRDFDKPPKRKHK